MATRRSDEPLRSFDALRSLLPDRDRATGGEGDAAPSGSGGSATPAVVPAARAVAAASGGGARIGPPGRSGGGGSGSGSGIRVGRESKGRAGKTVTLVRGLPPDDTALQALAQRLKTHCGAGCTVRDGVVEVQGDHVDRVVAFLVADGFAKTRRAGG